MDGVICRLRDALVGAVLSKQVPDACCSTTHWTTSSYNFRKKHNVLFLMISSNNDFLY